MFGRPIVDLLAALDALETREARACAFWTDHDQPALAREAARRSRQAHRAGDAVSRRVKRRITLAGQLPTTVEPY